MSFKGKAKTSSLDQVTLPPVHGISEKMYHRFGEWLKRMGYGWEYATEEQLCRWSVEFWNESLSPDELFRQFDRMATKDDMQP